MVETRMKNILKIKVMGIIREPEGIDFVIQSPPLTEDERKEISDFIKMRKLQKLAEKKESRKSKVKNRNTTSVKA